MNEPSSESPFGTPTLEQLTGLVFELASQLHIERVSRIALEAALESRGVLPPETAGEGAEQPAVRLRAAAALDRSMAGVIRVLTEDPDVRAPLRAQAYHTY